jgi:VWFA-related protein
VSNITHSGGYLRAYYHGAPPERYHPVSSEEAPLRLAPVITAIGLFVPMILGAQDAELHKRTPESEDARIKLERRITLDIEVADSTGNAVRGLSQNDFVVIDNGETKSLTSFQEMDGGNAQPPVEAILLLDAMNATFEDVGIMRQGIDAFLRQDGGRLPLQVSIVFLTDTGIKLNQPSSNGLELAKDFSKLQTPIRVLDSAQGIGGAIDRVQRSLHGLQMLSTYEASRPGRKLLLWIGPGWPLLAGAKASAPSAENARRYYSSIVDTTTQLRRAHITLYSVAPLNLAHDNGQFTFLYQSFLKGVTSPAQADSSNLGVQVLAVHSGGLVLNKSGDLPSQIKRCLADGSSFYEVTFDAAPGDEVGVYRSIDVTVDHPGANARTNTAYYAGQTQTTGGSLQTGASALSSVMREPTLRAHARLVVLDVTVIDNKGAPITGLSRDDFQLFDDSHPQKVIDLKEHIGAQGVQSSTVQLPAPGSSLPLSNKPPDGSIWNVVAVDLINTPKEDRARLQEQLQAFAKALPAGTPVALVSMAGDIKVLSSFTDGQAGLTRALKTRLGPLDIGGPANIFERSEIQESINVTDSASLQNKANVDVQRQAQRAQMTLDDFASIARWLNAYPGKKNVFWLSSGFPVEAHALGEKGYNDLQPAGPGTPGGQKLPTQDGTDRQLETARVAIYPLDVRGVAFPDIARETTADTGGNSLGIVVEGPPNPELDDNLKTGQQSEMLEIAHATGGVARFNNDLSTSLLQAVRQGESYYTISYTPQEARWDGNYHRFKLALHRPGVQVIYRQGYYARDVQAEPPPTTDQFRAALEPGIPSATSVLFTVNLLPNPDSAEVQYAIDPSTVRFTQGSNGKLLADLDCAILEFNAKGKILDKSLIRLSERTGPIQPPEFPATALNAKQTIALKPGATTLIVGVRDRATGLFGTLEVSISVH